MTQSGRGRGLTPAQFVQRLARTTDLSATEIGRQARAIGFRIGNDLLRAIVRTGRGQAPTPRQREAFLSFSARLSVDDPEGFRRNFARTVGEATDATIRRTRLAITVQASADVTFRWDRSGATEGSQDVVLTETVNIRGDQVQAFNANLQNLASSFIPRILQRGATLLNVNQNYGEVILADGPQIEVVRVAQV